MPKKNSGFSLIEVLVSLILLSILLFGLDGVILITSQENRGAYFLNLAVNQLRSITDQISAIGKSADLEALENTWNQENKMILPQGRGIISGNFPVYSVTIYWGKEKVDSCQTTKLGLSGCLEKRIELMESH